MAKRKGSITSPTMSRIARSTGEREKLPRKESETQRSIPNWPAQPPHELLKRGKDLLERTYVKERSRLTESEGKAFGIPEGVQEKNRAGKRVKLQIAAAERIIEDWLDARLHELYPGKEVAWVIPYHITKAHMQEKRIDESIAQRIKDGFEDRPRDFIKGNIDQKALPSFWETYGYRTVPEKRIFFPNDIGLQTQRPPTAVPGTEKKPSSAEQSEAGTEDKIKLGARYLPPKVQEVEKVGLSPPSTAYCEEGRPSGRYTPIEPPCSPITPCTSSLAPFVLDSLKPEGSNHVSSEDMTLDTTVMDSILYDENDEVHMTHLGTAIDPIDVEEEPEVHRYENNDPVLLDKHRRMRGTTLYTCIEEYTSAYDSLSFSQRKQRGIVATHGSDLMTLYQDEWLNDGVIDGFLGVVVAQDPLVSVWGAQLNSHTLHILGGKDSDGNDIKRSLEEEDVVSLNSTICESTRTLLVPLHVDGNHWILCVAQWQYYAQGTLNWYDSFGSERPSSQARVALVQECLEFAGRQDGSLLASISWRAKRIRNGTQNNSVDCGVFVCAHAISAIYQSWDGSIDGYREYIARRLLNAARGSSKLVEIRPKPLLDAARGSSELVKILPKPLFEDNGEAKLHSKCNYCSRSQKYCRDFKNGKCFWCRKCNVACIPQRSGAPYLKDGNWISLDDWSTWEYWSLQSLRELAIINGYSPDVAYHGPLPWQEFVAFLEQRKQTGDYTPPDDMDFPAPRLQDFECQGLNEADVREMTEYWVHEARKHGAPIRDGGEMTNAFYHRWCMADCLTRPTRRRLLLGTMRWSKRRTGLNAMQHAYDSIDESVRVLSEDRKPGLLNEPTVVVPRLLFIKKLGKALPTLEDNLPLGTVEDRFIRHIASMDYGAHVIILIHGLDGLIAKPEHWTTFWERWRYLDIDIEICARPASGQETWETFSHKVSGRKADRRWQTFKLERLIREFNFDENDRDPEYQKWISAMEQHTGARGIIRTAITAYHDALAAYGGTLRN
ncbi:MAG: hypothetical protein Q9218_003365 [Villophora microphyllina]